jgi:predicted nucleic acid-binding protein
LLRAVLDANVYVSAIIQPAGTPGRLIERFLRDERFEVVISPGIVDEVLRALGYRKVQRLLRGVNAQLWFEDIVVLAAALEGRARHVVTGDRLFLPVGEHAGVEIVTPRAFLDLLGR